MTDPGYRDVLERRIRDSVEAKQRLLDDGLLGTAVTVARVLVEALRTGHTVLFFGNGGSSTDAQHLAGELLGRFYVDRRPLPAVALADNTAAMTAIANDYSYADVFARQLRGLGTAGDVAVGLSTSGNSPNVVAALQAARELGLVTVGFTGRSGGTVAAVAEHCLRVPSDDTPRIQECHMLLGHTICEIVESELATG